MITDEQVRLALAVWFEERDYAKALDPTSHSMRSMRQTLEAVVGGDAEAGGWAAYSMTLEHPVHGTFWVYPGRGPGHIYAARCYLPKGAPEVISEDVATNLDTLAAAQAAVVQRIAELDAELVTAEPAAEPTLQAQVSP